MPYSPRREQSFALPQRGGRVLLQKEHDVPSPLFSSLLLGPVLLFIGCFLLALPPPPPPSFYSCFSFSPFSAANAQWTYSGCAGLSPSSGSSASGATSVTITAASTALGAPCLFQGNVALVLDVAAMRAAASASSALNASVTLDGVRFRHGASVGGGGGGWAQIIVNVGAASTTLPPLHLTVRNTSFAMTGPTSIGGPQDLRAVVINNGQNMPQRSLLLFSGGSASVTGITCSDNLYLYYIALSNGLTLAGGSQLVVEDVSGLIGGGTSAGGSGGVLLFYFLYAINGAAVTVTGNTTMLRFANTSIALSSVTAKLPLGFFIHTYTNAPVAVLSGALLAIEACEIAATAVTATAGDLLLVFLYSRDASAWSVGGIGSSVLLRNSTVSAAGPTTTATGTIGLYHVLLHGSGGSLQVTNGGSLTLDGCRTVATDLTAASAAALQLIAVFAYNYLPITVTDGVLLITNHALTARNTNTVKLLVYVVYTNDNSPVTLRATVAAASFSNASATTISSIASATAVTAQAIIAGHPLRHLLVADSTTTATMSPYPTAGLILLNTSTTVSGNSRTTGDFRLIAVLISTNTAVGVTGVGCALALAAVAVQVRQAPCGPGYNVLYGLNTHSGAPMTIADGGMLLLDTLEAAVGPHVSSPTGNFLLIALHAHAGAAVAVQNASRVVLRRVLLSAASSAIGGLLTAAHVFCFDWAAVSVTLGSSWWMLDLATRMTNTTIGAGLSLYMLYTHSTTSVTVTGTGTRLAIERPAIDLSGVSCGASVAIAAIRLDAGVELAAVSGADVALLRWAAFSLTNMSVPSGSVDVAGVTMAGTLRAATGSRLSLGVSTFSVSGSTVSGTLAASFIVPTPFGGAGSLQLTDASQLRLHRNCIRLSAVRVSGTLYPALYTAGASMIRAAGAQLQVCATCMLWRDNDKLCPTDTPTLTAPTPTISDSQGTSTGSISPLKNTVSASAKATASINQSTPTATASVTVHNDTSISPTAAPTATRVGVRTRTATATMSYCGNASATTTASASSVATSSLPRVLNSRSQSLPSPTPTATGGTTARSGTAKNTRSDALRRPSRTRTATVPPVGGGNITSTSAAAMGTNQTTTTTTTASTNSTTTTLTTATATTGTVGATTTATATAATTGATAASTTATGAATTTATTSSATTATATGGGGGGTSTTAASTTSSAAGSSTTAITTAAAGGGGVTTSATATAAGTSTATAGATTVTTTGAVATTTTAASATAGGSTATSFSGGATTTSTATTGGGGGAVTSTTSSSGAASSTTTTERATTSTTTAVPATTNTSSSDPNRGAAQDTGPSFIAQPAGIATVTVILIMLAALSLLGLYFRRRRQQQQRDRERGGGGGGSLSTGLLTDVGMSGSGDDSMDDVPMVAATSGGAGAQKQQHFPLVRFAEAATELDAVASARPTHRDEDVDSFDDLLNAGSTGTVTAAASTGMQRPRGWSSARARGVSVLGNGKSNITTSNISTSAAASGVTTTNIVVPNGAAPHTAAAGAGTTVSGDERTPPMLLVPSPLPSPRGSSARTSTDNATSIATTLTLDSLDLPADTSDSDRHLGGGGGSDDTFEDI